MGKFAKITSYYKQYGIKGAFQRIYARFLIKYYLGKKLYPLTLEQGERREQEAYQPERDVLISLVVPLYNTPEEYLREMIESVIGQTYSRWELCLVDASDGDGLEDAVLRYGRGDQRIRYQRLETNEGISGNTNAALAMAEGEYIGLLDHDDVLHPAALYQVMQEIEQRRADFIYSDELTFEGRTDRVQSIHLKPDFKQEGFRYTNYICHFSVFAKSLLEHVGGFRSDFDGAQDYDLFLRMTECAERICHIPKVLYYWRLHAASTASGMAAKPYILEKGRLALAEHLQRLGLSGEVHAVEEYGSFYRIRYHVPEDVSVSIVPENEHVAEWVRRDLRDYPLPCTVEQRPGQEGESPDYVVFVRDGFRPQQSDGEWLTELLSCLQPSLNGVSAPVVYDGTGHVCHAGFAYDMQWEDKLRPLFYGLPQEDSGYMNRLRFRQNVSLLGGAALAVRGDIFREYIQKPAGGSFSWMGDAFWFSLCLFAGEKGRDCVVTPLAPWKMCKGRSDIAGAFHWKEQGIEEFGREWDQKLRAGDCCGNAGMDVLGSYYFLWRGRRKTGG